MFQAEQAARAPEPEAEPEPARRSVVYEITGKTYDNKDKLRDLGARWHPGSKAWRLTVTQGDREDERALERIERLRGITVRAL